MQLERVDTRVLLAGVPFGKDNVGDEAILECIVSIVREECQLADITVSTADQAATSRKLDVRTIPLLGFDVTPGTRALQEILNQYDVFIWAGATGLSDYPEVSLEIMRAAQNVGTRTVLWGVGMNDELNPVHYTLLPGKRRKLLSMLSAASLDTIDAVSLEERRRQTRAKRKIRKYLNRADLVVVRDPESEKHLRRCGVSNDIIVGADSAIRLVPANMDSLDLAEDVKNILDTNLKKIGVCVSAQRKIRDTDGLVDFLNGIIDLGDTAIVFLPMNPITDAKLMQDLSKRIKTLDRAVVVEGRYEPSQVSAIASQLDVVISSRLHLLILSTNSHVPIIGVSRGSKIDNFLKDFGLKSIGSVDQCDFDVLHQETKRMLDSRDSFLETSRRVRKILLSRMDSARPYLNDLLRKRPS